MWRGGGAWGRSAENTQMGRGRKHGEYHNRCRVIETILHLFQTTTLEKNLYVSQ